ncbi:unnamed protein product [Malassezia sympodialis ATCC 42132]|uniref:uncharacterized protein n=1 Tax=Malassezia sympodialis (strain ATCC 42132) TaxID=1230383 RepID=UPI0002C23341|nr:uncharacterized protein MSY001_2929 [Malassezia sympodialis ATCC 42132]CCV00224.1 unnamed protein product [Malassezia sympodialis ATCC 42132]|eukprot:XP_018741430.1 uncharacterized protein MSY001_2929 [Malassezia sympodialis ATCC 42132]
MTSKEAVVLGAGVLGLTSALELRKKGYTVTVLARDLPSDLTSQSFASPWAGANWCSFAGTKEAERRRDAHTYKAFTELEKQLPKDLLAFMPFSCYHDIENDTDCFWFGDVCAGAPYRYDFRSLTLDAPKYLQWLATQLQDASLPGPPGTIARISSVYTLQSAAALVPKASVLVNATGLGSQDVREAHESGAYPIRGQTVLVRAPKFREAEFAHCYSKISSQGASYVIPRARSGLVILGGTFDVRNTSVLQPDPAVTERIIKNAIDLAPALLPDGVDPKASDAWTKVDVVTVNIGVRPAREGGARVELDPHALQLAGRRASHGIAAEVGELVEQWERTGTATTAKL